MAKLYLNVAYKDRELAKRLGARWDPSVKRWYCPSGSPLAKIFSWRKAGTLVSASDDQGSDFDAAPPRRDEPSIRSTRSLYHKRGDAGHPRIDQAILPFPQDKGPARQLSLLG